MGYAQEPSNVMGQKAVIVIYFGLIVSSFEKYVWPRPIYMSGPFSRKQVMCGPTVTEQSRFKQSLVPLAQTTVAKGRIGVGGCANTDGGASP